ncbi:MULTISPECIES: UDP-2,3-diacylglucosamine diphosphatase [Reichenbachiella]|uniref:UDP-2,3-diacylglucosamine diphosphatase n=1 Tax=Reichenbachiella TaxID=156993 RepID=UPI000E6CBBAA|nr:MULTISPECIES: UDP-2,3-diacylglucosamine diphosphatase [Reichenbachiella]MBU2915321.1 UDP-2,3-diacylglucosamine diphosphatase [Reichenbachiella agariperforans]RJE70543.1 hypothetical protein BGP76_10675 [Reichenbachiella sp. MSK19-1]
MNIDIPILAEGKKVYFASDFHLGAPDFETSLDRERRIIAWLDYVAADAQVLFLVGDLFDFWFEYRHVVPKGYVRFLGKLAELSDRGIEIVVFVGNHDLWLGDYLKEQLGATILHQSQSLIIGGRKFFIAHGDGLNPLDGKFRVIKKVFTNPVCQWLFSWLHPDVGITLANLWSGKSRHSQKGTSCDKHLIAHSERIQGSQYHDFYIYGDSHVDRYHELSNGAVYCNLGDWIDRDSYAEFDGEELKLLYFSL